MYSQVKPFLLHAISSLHVGSGSKIGLVDLPVQREKHTGYPKIESSSLKGAIRSTVRNQVGRTRELELVFGSELNLEGNVEKAGTEISGETVASAIALADARVLLFPVRSMRGVFAYVTCQHVIQRWNQEVSAYLGSKGKAFLLEVPESYTASSKLILLKNTQEQPNEEPQHSVVLEEYTWAVHVDEKTAALAEKVEAWFAPHMQNGQIANRLVVLKDEDFVDFVTLSTEVNARIRISDQTGTVENSALWYEENVPPETIFYSFLFSGQARAANEGLQKAEEVEGFVVKELPAVYQVGGNSTLGQGMMRHVWLGEEESE